ncbi:MAG: patatin-like phospholipase family protein [Bacteroidetes bacterium]|nr:patatin-like phospholipase family protein [Bacteroidota bacterium]
MKHVTSFHCRILIPAQKILLISFFFSVSFLSAQNPPGDQHGKRPSVGLVLSGGGAKGFAYIGLLRVMEEVGLPVDYIGGSSIGSIIGGLYAIGYHPDTIAKMIRSQHWNELLKDITERKYVAYEEKGIWEKTIVSLPLKHKKLGIGSMYQGQEINLLLNRFFSPAYKSDDFSKLPTPFLCIGTNLFTGEEMILKNGYLPLAIRASMSIPGYFAPTDFQGYYLVDGGVVNNYPAREVKQMGAEIIVGGNVQTGLYNTREQLESLTAIVDQITSFARIRANEVGDSLTNLMVRIKMPYGILDFEQYDSIMAIGERVARSHYKELKALADSLNAIEFRPLKKYEAVPLKSYHYDSLIIKGNQKIPNAYFNSIFDYENGDVDIKTLETDIRLTYGSGYFDRVSYEIENHNGKTCLVINAAESGAGEVSAGIHYDNDYGIMLTLGGAFRNIAGRNSKIFVDLNIAVNPRLRVTYLLGFGGKAAIGVSSDFYTFKIESYTDNVKDNRFNLTNLKGSLFFNYNFRNMWNLKAGFEYEYFRFKQDINVDSLFVPYEKFSSYGNVFAALNADTRDRVSFPTKGIRATLKAEYVMPFSKNWSQELFSNSAIVFLKFDQNIPLAKRFTLQPGLFVGAVLNNSGSPPIQHLFGLGGLTPDNYIESYVPFTGLHFIEDFGYYSLVGRLKLQCNVYKKMYFNLRADAGGIEGTTEDLFKSSNFLFGYGAAAGYDSFIGPVELTVMSSNLKNGLMVFLNIGYWF